MEKGTEPVLLQVVNITILDTLQKKLYTKCATKCEINVEQNCIYNTKISDSNASCHGFF